MKYNISGLIFERPLIFYYQSHPGVGNMVPQPLTLRRSGFTAAVAMGGREKPGGI